MEKNQHRYHCQVLTFVAVAFLLGCNEFLVVGVTSNIARTYQASLSAVGTLVTVFAMTYVLATPLITTLTSRWPRFRVLMAAMVVFLVGNTLTAMAPSLLWLFISRIIAAMVAGVIISLILVYGSIVAPPAKRPMLVAITYSGYNIATIVGVPLGTMITNLSTWQVSFFIISVLTVLVSVALFLVLPHQSEQSRSSVGHQLTLLGDRRVIYGVVIVIATYAAQYSFYTFIRPLLVDTLGFSRLEFNWILSFIGIMFIIGNFCAGWVAGSYRTSKMPLIETATLVLLLLMTPSFRQPWLGVAVIPLVYLLLGMPSSILQVMFLNVAAADYPAALNLASSLDPLCTNVGVMLGSLTVSFAVQFMPLRMVGLSELPLLVWGRSRRSSYAKLPSITVRTKRADLADDRRERLVRTTSLEITGPNRYTILG
ncbi:MAG: MFS transporter [[Lactobacillus] timonensis]|uniref:MFS transporter n=1 Tax=[Lactobacillus] timonensis TaxID=1970790 RepID=UPI0023548DDD|nr:MFS transporter [[Lactobacillus] timonensis]MCI1970966.1 MFS transporter [[Lactobacillus] timonensis]